MKKQDFLDTYNINLDDEDEKNFSGLYDIMVVYGIATEDEINLVLSLNGTSVKTLLDIIYVKSGLRSIEQLLTDLKDED